MRRTVTPFIFTSSPYRYVAKFAIAFIACVFLFKATVVEAFFVPSGSMIPTLEVRDYILVPKFLYGLRIPFVQQNVIQWGLPNRGDVVVFTRPDDVTTKEDESAQDMVKRVIGLPGETIEVKGTHVYLNGAELPEPYAKWYHGGFSGRHFGPTKVPAHEVFVLGDNRDESRDSRFWSYPFVDITRLKGRAMMVYWSGYDSGRVGTLVH